MGDATTVRAGPGPWTFRVLLPHNGGEATVVVSQADGFVITPPDLDPDTEAVEAAMTDQSPNRPTAALLMLRDAFESGLVGVEQAAAILSAVFAGTREGLSIDDLARQQRYEFVDSSDDAMPYPAGPLFNASQVRLLQVLMVTASPFGNHGIVDSPDGDPEVLVELWRAGHRWVVRSQNFPRDVLVNECLNGDRFLETVEAIVHTDWFVENNDSFFEMVLDGKDSDPRAEEVVARASPASVAYTVAPQNGQFDLPGLEGDRASRYSWSDAARAAAIEGLFEIVDLSNVRDFVWDTVLAHARCLAESVNELSRPAGAATLMLIGLGDYDGSNDLLTVLSRPPYRITALAGLKAKLDEGENERGSWSKDEYLAWETWAAARNWMVSNRTTADQIFEDLETCPAERLFPPPKPGQGTFNGWVFDAEAPLWAPRLLTVVLAGLSDHRRLPRLADWYCRVVPPQWWNQDRCSRWLTVDIPYFLHWQLGLVTEPPWWLADWPSSYVTKHLRPWTYWARVLPPSLAASIMSGDPGEGHEPF